MSLSLAAAAPQGVPDELVKARGGAEPLHSGGLPGRPQCLRAAASLQQRDD